MRRSAGLWRLLLVLALSGALVTACGGGGSSGSTAATGGNIGSPSTGNEGGGDVPEIPPPVQPPVYSGKTSDAPIDAFNTPALTSDAYAAINTIISLAYDYPPLNIDSTLYNVQSGPAGGKAVVKGRTNSDGSGWITIDYDEYKYRSKDGDNAIYTYDGEVQYHYPSGSDQSTPRVTIDLSPLKLTGPNTDTEIVGSISVKYITDSQVDSGRRYIGNLVETDNILHASIKMSDYIITGTRQLNVTGQVYDSRVGRVTVHTKTALQVLDEDGSSPPASGGPLVLTSIGDARAIVAFLSPSLASIGLDADGDGLIEQAIRLDWDSDDVFGGPTPFGQPEADAMLPTPVSVNKPVKLEGRFSHSVDNYVHFNWKLALAPPGSAAELVNTHTATPTLTPDRPGNYLVKLDVSNDTGSSSDTLVVHAGPVINSTAINEQGNAGMDAGPDRSVALGHPVTLDGRGTMFENDGTHGAKYPHKWMLFTPPGSQAALNDASAMQPTFTPDVPGIYYAVISHHSYQTYVTRAARVAIAAGTNEHLDFRASLADDTDQFAVGDLNNDGYPDILIDDNLDNLRVIYNHGGGRFSSPAPLAVDAGMTIADVDGDGRLDLIGPTNGGFTYRLQQLDGTLGPVIKIAAAGPCTYANGVTVAPLYGEARDSVLLTGCYHSPGDAVTIFPPSPDGVSGSPEMVTIGGMLESNLLAVDVTNDGIVDLVAVVDTIPLGGMDVLSVQPGRNDGTFGTAVTYPTSTNSMHVRIIAGDFNGDGHADVVLSDGDTRQIFFQQADGSLQSNAATVGAIGSLISGDVNGDGLTDLIGIGEFTDAVSGEFRTEIGFLFQQDDGSLADELLYPAYQLSTVFVHGIKVADMNADGIADLLYVSDDKLWIMLGDPLNPGAQAASVESVPVERRKAYRPRMPLVNKGFHHSAVWRGAEGIN